MSFAGLVATWRSFQRGPKSLDGVEHTDEYHEGLTEVLVKQEPRSRHEHSLLFFLPQPL